MVIDAQMPRSRRSLLAGLAGGLAAATAATLAGAQRVFAAGDDGQIVLVAGNYDDARLATRLENGSNGNDVLQVASETGIAVWASSDTGKAVAGHTTTGYAISGVSHTTSGFGVAVLAEAKSPVAAAGLSNNYATSGLAVGHQGTSDSQAGLASLGWAREGGVGIMGLSGKPFPYGSVPQRTGVQGRADQGANSVGVSGRSSRGRGGVFSGKLAQVQLKASTAATHPASGTRGDLFVDASGGLWFCKGGTTWKHLA